MQIEKKRPHPAYMRKTHMKTAKFATNQWSNLRNMFGKKSYISGYAIFFGRICAPYAAEFSRKCDRFRIYVETLSGDYNTGISK